MKRSSWRDCLSTTLLWILIAFIVALVPFRLLSGYSTFLHETAHKEAAEMYGLHPKYEPTISTFWSWQLKPAPIDVTRFDIEDQQKIKDGSTQMQQDILLAGIRSDINFTSWIIILDIALLLTITALGILAYNTRSVKLGVVALFLAWILMITMLWLFWQFNGSLPHNFNNPASDVQKLVLLLNGTL